jgi:hypothetical protein
MPITYEIRVAENSVITRWVGSIADDAMISAYTDLYSDTDWKSGFSEIADLQGADLGKISVAGLRRLSKLVDRSVGRIPYNFRSAIIAPAGSSYDLARIYSAYAYLSPEKVEVFGTENEAYEWIESERVFHTF